MKLSERATLPKKFLGGAGYDLSAAENAVNCSGGRAVQLPEGTYGRIAGRSGLAIKFGINIAGGVIDNRLLQFQIICEHEYKNQKRNIRTFYILITTTATVEMLG